MSGSKLPPIRAIALCAMGLSRSESGITHEVGGNNMGPAVQFKQRVAGGIPGESWCADHIFESMVKADCQICGLFLEGATDARNQAIILARADEFSKLYDVPRTGSCIRCAEVAHEKGRFHNAAFVPSPGDQVLFDMKVKGKRLGRPHHTEFVIRVLGNGLIECTGGNTSSGIDGSQGNGDGVFIRTRHVSDVYGYVHW